MAVREEDIFQAADELNAEGVTPSAISIREILKTGSLGTIQKHLKAWREKSVTPSAQPPPAASVLEVSQKWAAQVWGTAWAQARQEMDARIHEIQASLKQSQEDAEAAWKEVERFEEDEKKWGVKLDDERRLREEGAANQHALEEKIAELGKENAEREKAREQLARELALMEEKTLALHQKTERLRRELDEEHRRAVEAERMAAANHGRLEELQRLTEEARAEARSERERCEELQARIAVSEERAHEAERRREEALENVADFRERLAATRFSMEELERCRRERDALNLRMDELMRAWIHSRPAAGTGEAAKENT